MLQYTIAYLPHRHDFMSRECHTIVLFFVVVLESRQPGSVVLGARAPKDRALCFYQQGERVWRTRQSSVAIQWPGQGSADATFSVQDLPENLEAGVRHVCDERKSDAQLWDDRRCLRVACHEPDELRKLQH